MTAVFLLLLLAIVTGSGCRPDVQADDPGVPASPAASTRPARPPAAPGANPAPATASTSPASGTGLSYTNVRVANVPWSIHVVAVDRAQSALELHSVHAGGAAVGLGTLTRQLSLHAGAADGKAVAAINGDFYQRDRSFAGDPRGLQIVDGEVISAPSGGAAFWLGPGGEPMASNVVSRFEVTWPDGRRSSFGLNGEPEGDRVTLYTPAAGNASRSSGGREFVLERSSDGAPWLPLRIGVTLEARIRAIRDSGGSRSDPDTLVLLAGPFIARTLQKVEVGGMVKISTASVPDLAGVRDAIGGGPVLLRSGKRLKIAGGGEGYESSSMFERHPRSAIAWNAEHFYLVEVDGRQRGLSMGMTLDELATWLGKFGCTDAMNLDGGGSATLWYNGAIRNSPCDGRERPIANSLVVVRRNTSPVVATPASIGSSGTGTTVAAPAPGLNGK